MKKLPRIGTRVRVPFGFDEAEGEVIDTYEGAIGPEVRVAVELGSPGDGVLTVNFPLDKVEAADAA